MNGQGFFGVLHDWWAVIATMVAGFFSLFLWAARIQRHTNENSLKISQLEKTHNDHLNSLNKRLDELNSNQRDMAKDINTILLTLVNQRGGNG